MSKSFKYKLNINQKLLFILVLVPFHELLGSYISNALTKIILMFIPALRSTTIATIMVNYIFDILLALLGIYIFYDVLKEQFQQIKKHDYIDLVVLIALGVAGVLCANLIGSYISKLVAGSASASNQQNLMTLVSQYRLPMIILCVLIGPLGEELLYRVGWFTLIAEVNKPLAYIISSLLFGLTHVITYILQGNLAEIYQAFPYILVGFGLAYIYDHYESFAASYAVHALYNLLAFIV